MTALWKDLRDNQDNHNQGSRHEWGRWNTDALCPGETEAMKTEMQSVGENVKTLDQPQLLIFFCAVWGKNCLCGREYFLESFGAPLMVSYTVICCPQGAPNCGNYCFDYSTFWSEITDCIHSAATKMKMYYYYKRLEGTQKFLTTYLVDSSNMTFILLTHHSLWPKKKKSLE